jgi:predicted amidohydrolase
MKIALLQFTINPFAPEQHITETLSTIKKIASTTDLILLPEMWNTGLYPELATSPVLDNTERLLEELQFIANQNQTHIIPGSMPLVEKKGISNTCWLLSPNSPKQILYQKSHLFTLGKEDTYTIAGDAATPVFEINGNKLAIFVCYDLRFPELFRSATFRGAELLLVPAQWPLSRKHHWISMLTARAIENQAYVVGCNLCGSDGILDFAGTSRIIDPWGNLIAEGNDNPTTISADLDFNTLRETRLKYPFLQDAKWKVPLIKLGTR